MSIPSIDLGPIDEGFTVVKIGEVEKQLDVYEEHHHLLEAQRQDGGRGPTAFYSAVAERLKSLGYGDIPHRIAYGFVNHVNQCVSRLNALGQTPSGDAVTATVGRNGADAGGVACGDITLATDRRGSEPWE